MLPQEFIDYTSRLFGTERWQRYVDSFGEALPVSVRYNPFKPLALLQEPAADECSAAPHLPQNSVQVPWCRNAYYLPERPDFTHDPLLHAGVYYVQEASSMFLDHVLQSVKPIADDAASALALDLCAAPGGKSTLLRAALPESCLLYSNEPDRRRANILMENIQKQGHPRVVVTNNYAIDYQRAAMQFDFILCDVPCSGEGMFRKDSGAIGEWSLQNVMKCSSLQRSIIEDIWPCLRPGGVMVYSTCTFNLHENEENVKWIAETLGAELIAVPLKEEWNITGSLLEGWNQPVYRFIPGTARGEGLFMAVLRKTSDETPLGKPKGMLRVMCDGKYEAVQKKQNDRKGGKYPQKSSSKPQPLVPAHAEALLINLPRDKYPIADVDLDTALHYLHHEAIVLDASVPKGYVIVSYKGFPLGFVKNIGNRANNLYPQEWKIRKM